MSNAIKFTPKGGSVEVELQRSGNQAKICVSDSGVGISPRVLPFIFDRFRQADSASTRQHGGLGLGLAIVRHLVEMHHGTVEAESKGEHKGATFRVTLPLIGARDGKNMDDQKSARLPLPPYSKEPMRQTGWDCKADLCGVHILVVDDEEDGRALIKTVLEKCGARVTTTASAAEALDALIKLRPDALLSDLGMPGEDGYSLIQKVRALPPENGGQTPAAALTAYAALEDRMRVLRSGFQIHLPKPIEPAELVAVVGNLTGRPSQ